MFPIAPHFYPMWFVQSSPLLTYIAGPKGTFSIFTQKLQASEKSGFFLFWLWVVLLLRWYQCRWLHAGFLMTATFTSGQSEWPPTSTQWKMDDRWTRKVFLSSSSLLANYPGYDYLSPYCYLIYINLHTKFTLY